MLVGKGLVLDVLDLMIPLPRRDTRTKNSCMVVMMLEAEPIIAWILLFYNPKNDVMTHIPIIFPSVRLVRCLARFEDSLSWIRFYPIVFR